jgi:hypothetical protein
MKACSGCAALHAALSALSARVEALEAARSTTTDPVDDALLLKVVISQPDRGALQAILPAIAGAQGSNWFTLKELRSSSSAGVQIVLAGLSSERVGRLFARAVGLSIDGYRLERGGKSHGAALWRIVAIIGELQPPQPPRPSGATCAGVSPWGSGDRT